MKAAVTEKLLRSLLAKGEPHEPIWDEVAPHLEWRINKRAITGSVVGRIRGSGIRQPICLLAGHFPLTPIAEIRQHGRKLRHDLDSGIDPRAIKRERLQAEAAERAASLLRWPSNSSSVLPRHVPPERLSCVSGAS